MGARQEGGRRREVGIDDENADVGGLRRAVVGRVFQVLIQGMCVRPADGGARLHGKGPRSVFPQLGEDIDEALHDMGIGPDRVGIVGAEPGTDEEVGIEDLEADVVDCLIQSGLLDHVSPVQEPARLSLGSGGSLRPLFALRPLRSGLSFLALRPLGPRFATLALLARRPRLSPLTLWADGTLLALAGGQQHHQTPDEDPTHAGYW